MISFDEIKNDNELEPFFLDYIRCAEESNDLPEEMPKDISEEEAESIIKTAYKADVSLLNLLSEINDKYKTEYDADEIEDDDEIAEILNQTCEHYIDMHTIETIMARQLEFINDDNLDLTDLMLDNGINFCEKCNTEKVEYRFKELPDDIKTEFKDMEESAEYFMYCPVCKDYAVIYPN